MNLNLGTQDRKKVIMAAGFGVVAIGCLIYMFNAVFGGPGTPPPAATTVTTTSTTVTPAATRTVSTTNTAITPVSSAGSVAGREAKAGAVANAAASGSQSQNPELRLDLLQLAEHTQYQGTGRNVFSAEAPPPLVPIAAAPIRPLVATPVNTGPPAPPPIDLQFYGYATSKGQKKRVFLKHGEDIFIAAEGDIVNHRYRIKSISNNSVEIEDILNNNTQPIALSSPQG